MLVFLGIMYMKSVFSFLTWLLLWVVLFYETNLLALPAVAKFMCVVPPDFLKDMYGWKTNCGAVIGVFSTNWWMWKRGF